jgi:hypothetical protein
VIPHLFKTDAVIEPEVNQGEFRVTVTAFICKSLSGNDLAVMVWGP